eukprot:CAMPEP_0206237270 /NCGR_PEP_ID=MMETSP0047_2-20121206/14176_1 /ASSEMBLY_ACC=CAM_ASM_000192 /TAXON_ID=195065 /ORGANISM="Chroomonas mesostigmatica_cf, Strain CCMP1168" /LENGTH=280 /DNA_ID=CAMNT_0053661695 /DNA_START=90 /DNA_END=932 /DNA_ORIENTATION=-
MMQQRRPSQQEMQELMQQQGMMQARRMSQEQQAMMMQQQQAPRREIKTSLWTNAAHQRQQQHSIQKDIVKAQYQETLRQHQEEEENIAKKIYEEQEKHAYINYKPKPHPNYRRDESHYGQGQSSAPSGYSYGSAAPSGMSYPPPRTESAAPMYAQSFAPMGGSIPPTQMGGSFGGSFGGSMGGSIGPQGYMPQHNFVSGNEYASAGPQIIDQGYQMGYQPVDAFTRSPTGVSYVPDFVRSPSQVQMQPDFGRSYSMGVPAQPQFGFAQPMQTIQYGGPFM